MLLSTGDRLGPYEILSALGAGGMGEVWKARDTRLGRIVAIKVSQERFSDRFEREARSIAALNHPNICTLFDVGPDYLVMELVEGPTLAERIAKGRLSPDEAIPIARQIAEALEAAHEKGIIHRDLKPANIKLTADGNVKVLDFGLAKAVGETAAHDDAETATVSATRAGSVIGTAAYMSPEQARGETIDKRADIWSFGVVLYEMTAGKPPFQGKTAADLLAAVLTQPPDWDAVPVRIRRVAERCLEKNPKRRIRDAGDVRLALEEEPAAPQRTARVLPWALAGALAGALAMLAASQWRPTRATSPLKLVASPFMNLSVDLGTDPIVESGRTVTVSPDGTRIVFRIGGAGGKRMLAVRSLDLPSNRSTITPLAGTEGGGGPFFSPDGRWLAYWADRKLKKIPIQGGASVTLCDAPESHGASWGENDQIFAILGSGTGLFRVDAGGGTPQLLAKPADRKQAVWAWPQVLPGGESVLYTANEGVKNFNEASIEVLSWKTGKWKTLQRGAYYGRYLRSGHLVWVRNQTLFGARFDPVRLELKSVPVPIVESDLASMADDGSGQFDFSDTGTLVYVSGERESYIVWVDSKGKMQSLISTPARYRDPSLSPDGKFLAVAAGLIQSEIYIFDLEHRALSQRAFLKPCRIPAWTSDGRHVLFACTAANTGTLWWMRADGSGEPHALYSAPGSVERFSLSPDGRTLLVVTRENEVFLVSLDTRDPDHPKAGKQELFMRAQHHGTTVAFSPDGRWVAYSDNDEGENGIYVRPASLLTQGKWQISSSPARHPTWSRKAPQLLYQDTNGHLLVVDYAVKGDTFSHGSPRLWVENQFADVGDNPGRSFDLAPDGNSIVALVTSRRFEGSGNLHVTFLVNLFDELRRRIPEGK